MSSSSARAEQARINGARSSGPKTEEGKARSAGNARRHGLCSAHFTIDDAGERAAFDALHRDVVLTYGPVGEAQERTVEEIAIANWRERRLAEVEMRVLDAALAGGGTNEPGGLPSLSTICRYRARIARDLREAEARLGRLRDERAKSMQRRLDKAGAVADPVVRAAVAPMAGALVEALALVDTNEPEPSIPASIPGGIPMTVPAICTAEDIERLLALAQRA